MKMGIFNNKNEHKIKGRQYMTLMLITDATKDPKSIKIPKWIRFPVLILTVAVILGSMYLYQYVVGLEANMAMENLETMEANMASDSKSREIEELNSELDLTKEERYEQLLELQKLADELGLQLEELEDYRTEMAEFKEEIDTNLSNSDETQEESDLSNDDTGSVSEESELTPRELGIGPDILNDSLSTASVKTAAQAYDEAMSYSQGIGGPYYEDISSVVYSYAKEAGDEVSENVLDGEPLFNEGATADTVDFDLEIERLNNYLTSALNEVTEGEDDFAVTAESLESIIPYVEAYPSILPLEDTKVTSSFGYRKNPFGGYSSEFHSGIDLQAYYEPIVATGGGVVVEAGYKSGYGYTVLIDHGYGLMTKYAHNSKIYVSVGDEVVRGDVIAKTGNTGRSTGPHLHYEVLLDGEFQNPLDYVYDEDVIE